MSALSSSTFTAIITRESNPNIDQRVEFHKKNRLDLKIFPDIILTRMIEDGQHENFSTVAELGGKKVILFSVKEAWSEEANLELKSYMELAERIKVLGIDKIICVVVENLKSTYQWSLIKGDSSKVEVWADNEGMLADRLGLGFNNSGEAGQGYAFNNACMRLENCSIKDLWIDSLTAPSVRARQIFEKLRAEKLTLCPSDDKPLTPINKNSKNPLTRLKQRLVEAANHRTI